MFNPTQDSNVQSVYNEILEPAIEYKKPEMSMPEKMPKLQQSKSTTLCLEMSKAVPNQNSEPKEITKDKHDSPLVKDSSPSRVDEDQYDEKLPEKVKKTVTRKRKYQKRKSSTAKRRKATKPSNRGHKNSQTVKDPTIQAEVKPNSCTAPLFSNTESSDDEVTIPESLIEENAAPSETGPENDNDSKRGKANRKRNSHESNSQKPVEMSLVRRSSRQSVPPTEVYQSFRVSPRRKPAPKKEVPTKNTQFVLELKEQKDPPDENPPIKTSEEESTFDTNCPPPPFVCVTDTDSESSDSESPNSIVPNITNAKNEAPKETVRRSGRASKRPAKYSEGLTNSTVEKQAVSKVPEASFDKQIGSIDWKERYDELKIKFDEQAKQLDNEKLKNLKLEVEHLRERNQLQVNETLISETEIVIIDRSIIDLVIDGHYGRV